MSSLNQQIDAHKVHSGWLYKKGWYNTSWKKRYFVLYDDRTIHYFAKDTQSMNRTKAKGKIHLTQIRRVELVSYNDPKNKHNASPTSSISRVKLYRKTSLPLHLSGPYHCQPSPIPSPPHMRQTKSHSNIPLSPQHLSLSNDHNTIRSKTPTDILNKSFNYTQKQKPKKERATSVHYVPKCQSPPSSSNGVSPLQSINEKESVSAVTILQPFTMKNDYFSAALSPDTSPKDNNIAVYGVNGWSFNGMNFNDINDISTAVGNYYSTPSNIVSSSQPPPDYNDIIKHEKKFEKQRQELDKSLLELRNTQNRHRKAHEYDIKTNNKENKPQKTRPPVPITRRKTRGRAQSVASAQMKRDISCLNDNKLTLTLNGNSTKMVQNSLTNSTNVNINRRTRSASCVYIPKQPLTLQSSSTTTFQSVAVNNNSNERPRLDSNVSNTSTTSNSLTPYHSLIDLNNSVETVECELSDTDVCTSDINSGRDRGRSCSSDINSSFNSSFNSNVSSDYMAGFGFNGKREQSKSNKDVILSTEIRRTHSQRGSLSMTGERDKDCDGYSPYDISESKKDEFDIFETVMNDTQLGLSCNKRYSFSLIHPNREYILSAETNEQLKEWISIFSKLVQGKPIYSGYLALKNMKKERVYNKKFFILFENKVLNYYKDCNDVNNGNACEFDIDLRHVMWLRYCSKNEFDDCNLNQMFGKPSQNDNNISTQNTYVSCQTAYFNTPSGNSVINPMAITKKTKKKKKKKKGGSGIYSLEIAIPNRIFIMTAETQRIRNEWYNKIRSVFSDTLILKRYFDSAVSNIYFGHNECNFKNRYIALFKDMLVVFQNKKKLNTIKRMTFFDETRFREYIRKNHCTIIPINDNVKVRKCEDNKYGKYTFVVANEYDDRKWYFNCIKKEDLDQWIYLLVTKRKKQRKKSNSNSMKTNININNNKLSVPKHNRKKSKRKKKMKHKKDKNKNKSCDVEVDSTLSTPFDAGSDIRSTIINKRMEIRDNTSNPSECNTNDMINDMPENYDLSLVSNKESPIPKTDISNISPIPTARYYKNINTNAYAGNYGYIIPYKSNVSVNVNKNKPIIPLNKRDRVTEKLTRSYSDDLSDDNRYIITHTNNTKYTKKQRSISVDTHDLSPKNKSKVNINLSEIFRK